MAKSISVVGQASVDPTTVVAQGPTAQPSQFGGISLAEQRTFAQSYESSASFVGAMDLPTGGLTSIGFLILRVVAGGTVVVSLDGQALSVGLGGQILWSGAGQTVSAISLSGTATVEFVMGGT